MHKIYDNIHSEFLIGLIEEMRHSKSVDFCTGYFTVDGFYMISDFLYETIPEKHNEFCRIIVGRNINKFDDNKKNTKDSIEKFIASISTGIRLQKKSKLERLQHLIKLSRVRIKFSSIDSIHAKLYLFHFFSKENRSPRLAILGSSNLTFNGLKSSAELNVSIDDKKTCFDLQKWFDNQWNKSYCIDVSDSIAWREYRQINDEDLNRLAYACDKYKINQLIDSNNDKYTIPNSINYDRKGIEIGINDGFILRIHEILKTVDIDDIYFPDHIYDFDAFPFCGRSVMDFIIETYVDVSDPNYIDPEILEAIEKMKIQGR